MSSQLAKLELDDDNDSEMSISYSGSLSSDEEVDLSTPVFGPITLAVHQSAVCNQQESILIEVFVGNFMGGTNNLQKEHL